MGRKTRTGIFLVAAACVAALYLAGLRGLPPFGHYRGPYGDILNAIAVPERHITDVVTGVNFDFRAFDTMGEEYIMFASVTGAVLLLRRLKGEVDRKERDSIRGRTFPRSSDATRTFTLGIVGLLTLFGIYIVTHGHLTPGGGFQGGVILATAPLAVYLAGNFRDFRHVTRQDLVEISEAVGAGGYAVIGLLGMVAGGMFLENVIPQGTVGDVISGGTIALLDITVGLAVAGGFVVLLTAFLEEALRHEPKEDA
jgi:multicomponent Na+:H+ antiporter subunit B